MANDETWRQRRAEELGLVDTGPSFGRVLSRAPRVVAADAVDPMRLPPSADEAVAPLWPPAPRGAATANEPAPGRGPTTALAGWARPEWLVAALITAASLGWLARGAFDEAPPRTLPAITAAPISRAAPAPTAAKPVDPVTVPAPSVTLPVAGAASPAPPVASPPPAAREATPPPAPSRALLPGSSKAEAEIARPVRATVGRVERHAEPRQPVTSRLRYPAKPVAAPGRSYRPSFNCRRASTDVTRMICADRRLSALDVQMAESYRSAVRNVDPETERIFDSDQSAFLNARSRCATEACIARAYENRIDELEPYTER